MSEKVIWNNVKCKSEAVAAGGILIGDTFYNSDGVFILGKVESDVRIRSLNGGSIEAGKVRVQKARTSILWSEIRNEFLCDDIYCGVVSGFTPNYIAATSILADKAVIAMCELALNSKKQFFRNVADEGYGFRPYDNIEITVRHVPGWRDTVEMSIFTGAENTWTGIVDPVGGNIYLQSECSTLIAIYAAIRQLYKDKKIQSENLKNCDFTKFTEV